MKKKYFDDDFNLREYCIENNFDYKKVFGRCVKLRNQFPNLEDDKLIDMATVDYQNPNIKYFYDGMPLICYCRLHPEIKYVNLKGILGIKAREKGRDLTSAEVTNIVDEYIKKTRRKIKIKRFCEENDYEYKNVLQYYLKHRKDKKYSNLSYMEKLDKILDSYSPFKIQFPYKGSTLSKYCEEHNLPYATIASYARNRLKKDNTLDLETLLDEGVKMVHRFRVIYYYGGMPLSEYGKLHPELNISSIRSAIVRRRAKTDLPLQDIVNYCVENYQKFEGVYYYDGMLLSEYCRMEGLDYALITKNYRRKYRGVSKLTKDQAIKELVEYYKENPPVYTKYYFGDTTLFQFCKSHNYNYGAILSRIYNLMRKETDDVSKTVLQAVSSYEKNLYFQNIREVFQKLTKISEEDKEELNLICNTLKIDVDKVFDLMNMDFDLYQAVSMIWYFYDILDENGLKSLSDNGLEEIFRLSDTLINIEEEDIKHFDLYDLIRLYKAHLYDSRSEILIRQSKYLNSVIFSICEGYGISVTKSLLEDFKNELEICLLVLIDKTYSNYPGEVIRYMDLVIKGTFKDYIRNYKREYEELFLDKGGYDEDCVSLKDLIANGEDECLDDNQFSQTMMKILRDLDKDKLQFIILRFQEEYSYGELASFYNVSIEDVQKMENDILLILRDSGNFDEKKLKYSNINE